MSAKIRSLDDFLLLLKGVKQEQSGQFKALCPGHDDRQRSLSVTQAKGKILVNCFAGCELTGLLKPLELEPKDLFRNSHGPASRVQKKLVATFSYEIDKGNEAYQIRRFDLGGGKKTFEAWHKESGRNVSGMGDYKGNPILYHLPEVKEWLTSGEIIRIPEGEKKADRLISMGLPATTSPFGAGPNKWRSEYSQTLAGADVIILPDNDRPGREFAEIKAKSLYGTAKSVKIVELPGLGDKEDIIDWLNTGHTKDELLKIETVTTKWQPPPQTTLPQPPVLGSVIFNLTDLGNAERLVQQFGNRLRYCYEHKRWIVWNGKVWEWDSGAMIKRLAKLSVRNIYHEAGSEPDEKRRKELASHAKSSESDHRINAIISLAQSEPGIPIKVTELDTNPWLFNCLNGTLDLRTGQLLPHRKEDLLTIIVPVEFHIDAQCPGWLSFLDRVTGGNTELAGYLQRAIGYSLTGDTKSQVLFFLYGLGNNGKSTFTTTIRKVLGDYADRASLDLFMVKDKNTGGPKESLANLKGRRFVVGSELEDGRRLAVGLIKDMTGGETIKADRKYEHEVEYQPEYKIWLVGNHKPVITDTTLSIWRRVKLIPFTVTIPNEEVDPDLPSKLEAELPGILAWAVKGSLNWQRYGLREPDAVTTATASYRHEQDILGDFIEDCCILEPLASIPKADLKDEYHRWCQDNSVEPVSQRTFKVRLIEKGITESKSGSIRYWKGITLESLVPNGTENVPDSHTNGTTGTQKSGKSLYKEKQKEFTENSAQNVPVSQNENVPAYPIHPCHNCGCGDYWLTDWNEWLCSCCHPKPGGVTGNDSQMS